MPTTRIKDLSTTTTSAASDDYVALDGLTNGTRKMLGSKLVAAPASTTDNAVVRYDGTAGQVQNSGVTIDDSGKLMASPTLTGSSGTVSGAKVGSTINQSGTAGYDVLLVDASTAAAGSGSKYLIRATTGDSVTQFSVDNSGNTATTGNLTVSGTGLSSIAGDLNLGTTAGGLFLNPRSAPGNPGTSGASVLYVDSSDNQVKIKSSNGTVNVLGGATGNTTVTGNLTVSGTGTSTFAGPVQLNGAGNTIKGTTTNDNAATGYVGEYVSSTVAIGSAVSLTNTTPANMTSIPLTAGDWDVEVNASYNLSGASGVTLFSGVNTTSATFGDNSTYSLKHTPMTTVTAVDGLVSNIVRVSLSGSATVYGVVRADFSAGTVGAFGSMRARRVR